MTGDPRYRRKRWISPQYAERTGARPSASRTIEIWCEEASHEPVFIGELCSRRMGPYEGWMPKKGPTTTTQRLIPAYYSQSREDVLALIGLIATRHRFLCPMCGLDVLAGDRLGNPGARSVRERVDMYAKGLNAANAPCDMKAMAAAEKTDAVLSRTADAGVSRLPLSTLGRILSL